MRGFKITGCFLNCENSIQDARLIFTNSSLISFGRLLPTCSSFANKPFNALAHFFRISTEQPGAVKALIAAIEANDVQLLSY